MTYRLACTRGFGDNTCELVVTAAPRTQQLGTKGFLSMSAVNMSWDLNFETL